MFMIKQYVSFLFVADEVSFLVVLVCFVMEAYRERILPWNTTYRVTVFVQQARVNW